MSSKTGAQMVNTKIMKPIRMVNWIRLGNQLVKDILRKVIFEKITDNFL